MPDQDRSESVFVMVRKENIDADYYSVTALLRT
jgi:hypothetical protein